MKLRYYLRGLGIGIIVTALMMGIATRDNAPMTDAEIKAAAYALGMVDSNSIKLSDIRTTEEPGDNNEAENVEDTAGSSEAENAENAAESSEAENAENAAESSEAENAENAAESSEAENAEDTAGSSEAENVGDNTEDTGNSGENEEPGETVSITIKSGSGSRTVCNQLKEAGLIEDAGAFDQYLVDNGYSRRICVGTYKIESGSDWEKIAKIITKTR